MALLVAVFLVAIADIATPAASDVPSLVALINDSEAEWEVRADAEAQLTDTTDPQAIEAIWETLNQPVVYRLDAPDILLPTETIAAFAPGTPSPVLDQGLPIGVQIVHARLRLWHAVTRSAGTRIERSTILNDLLMREQSAFSKKLVLSACMANWSDALAGTIDVLVRDQAEECWVREQAVYLLMVHELNRFPDLVDLAWEERGQPCADALSRWLTRTQFPGQTKYDVRLVLLRIDAFERLRLEGDVSNAGLFARDVSRYATLNISDAGSAEAPVGTLDWYERMCRDFETWIEGNRLRLEFEAAALGEVG